MLVEKTVVSSCAVIRFRRYFCGKTEMTLMERKNCLRSTTATSGCQFNSNVFESLFHSVSGNCQRTVRRAACKRMYMNETNGSDTWKPFWREAQHPDRYTVIVVESIALPSKRGRRPRSVGHVLLTSSELTAACISCFSVST